MTLKNFFKRNYEFISCIVFLVIIFFICITPKKYISSTFYGFSVWAKIVLPSLFCFFILTKILQNNAKTKHIFGKLDFVLNKIYKVKGPSTYICFMSLICGYPIGAKLISEFYLEHKISKNDAYKLISFSSTSGPMFVLGSVASSMLGNIKIGIIILVSHYIATFLNGLIYRNFKLKNKAKIKNKAKLNIITFGNIQNRKYLISRKKQKNIKQKKQNLNDIMLETITSVLMIGGFLALSFTLIEFLNSLKIFSFVEKFLTLIFHKDLKIISPILSGILELTNGCLGICNFVSNKFLLTIILCALISFGGLSIHLQTNIFLSKCKIKYSYFLLTKITHAILSIVISCIFSLIFM